jgi:mono/diheme cytochrome c family protein
MKIFLIAMTGTALLGFGLAAQTGPDSRGPRPAPASLVVAHTQMPAAPAPPPLSRRVRSPAGRSGRPHAPMAAAAQRELVATYCATCHSDRAKAGGLSLAGFDPATADKSPDVAEKIIRKLTAGMMPPAGAKRPDEATLAAFLGTLETHVDAVAEGNPSPGWRPFQRLTRAEYTRSVKELLDLDVDVASYLPPDTITDGFDNVADGQTFSPALLDGYLRAASQISRLAFGDSSASATTATYTVSGFRSQMEYVDGTPFGSRGGLAIAHVFPADGTYRFTAKLVRTVSGELFGNTAVAMADNRELIEVTLNGDRVAVLDVHPGMSDADAGGLTVTTPPIHVKAGPQALAVAFVARQTGPLDDLLTPIRNTLIDTRYGTGFGITSAPHLQDVTITGPLEVTGVSETPSRRRVFTCRPTTSGEEATCAAAIVRGLAVQAFRGVVQAEDLDDLMRIYEQGREDESFEGGLRLAVQAMLAHPRFLFRVEPRATGNAARIAELALASRLSYFVWGSVPDATLVEAARAGRLSTPAGVAREVRRMLADPRAEALTTRFWSQWLRLQDVAKMRPDGLLYPYWDVALSEGFTRETQLFFDHLVREDRSLLEMLTADYSFVNERVARHYGITNVVGPQFRKVQMPETRRAGILTQGSTLLLTSVADRTSPVQRGKWVMQVLLASPPPPPPPNVPALEDTKAVADGRLLTVRERMEQHRSNPACNSCHRVIDPIGLALENFDVTGRWRIKDSGMPVEVTGELYDGTPLDGPAGLRDALLQRKDAMLRSFTESLMTYALGRRVEYFDMPTVRAIIRDAAAKDYKVSAFILGVATSPAFRMMGPEAVETSADDRARR